MMEGFLVVCRLLGIKVIDENGRRLPVSHFRDDAAELEDCRSDIDHILKANSCVDRLVQALHKALAYACSLDGETVPLLMPSENVALLTGAEQADTAAEMVLGRSIAKIIQSQTAKLNNGRDERLVEQIEQIIAKGGYMGAPSSSKYLNTDQVASQLGLVPKTVRKLFSQKQLIGRKFKGGEWRTTQDDLDCSPYLQSKNGRTRAKVE